MAACATQLTGIPKYSTSENSTAAPPSEKIALKRFTELLKRQEQIIDLLQIYTPEQIIAHLKNCPAAWHCRQTSGGFPPEKAALLEEIAETHTLEEITDSFRIFALAKQYGCDHSAFAAALHLRQQHNANQAKYYAQRKTALKRKTTAETRTPHAKNKSTAGDKNTKIPSATGEKITSADVEKTSSAAGEKTSSAAGEKITSATAKKNTRQQAGDDEK